MIACGRVENGTIVLFIGLDGMLCGICTYTNYCYRKYCFFDHKSRSSIPCRQQLIPTNMAQSYASPEEIASHDPVMRKLMHGKSSEERNAFLSMLKKDHKAHSDVTREYVGHWESNGVARDDDVARDQRKSNYATLVNK